MPLPYNDAEMEREKLQVMRDILETQQRCELKLDRILAKLEIISRQLGTQPSAAAKQIDALKKELGISDT